MGSSAVHVVRYPTRLGMLISSPRVKSTIRCRIHGRIMTRVRPTAMILGMKVRVISWTWVTAWKMLTARPMTRA